MTKYNLIQIIRIAILSLIIAIMLSILIQFRVNAQELYVCEEISLVETVDEQLMFYDVNLTVSQFLIKDSKVVYTDSLLGESYVYSIGNMVGDSDRRSWTATSEIADGYFDFVIDKQHPDIAEVLILLYFSDMTFAYICKQD